MSELQPMALKHEGVALQGLVAVPRGRGPFPAVMVMSTALGLGEQMKERTLRLAELGYVALATDMYGGGVYFFNPKESAMGTLHKTPELLRARVVAWYDALKKRPDVDPERVAAIGFCFGGQCVLELARSGADVKAVVSYHGLLTTAAPARPGAVKGEVVIYSGAKDPYAPLDHVDAVRAEMMEAGARWHITVFGEAEHGFTDPQAGSMNRPGIKYDRLADELSWAGTLALLKATIGDAPTG